jgi:hypothetical protein
MPSVRVQLPICDAQAAQERAAEFLVSKPSSVPFIPAALLLLLFSCWSGSGVAVAGTGDAAPKHDLGSDVTCMAVWKGTLWVGTARGLFRLPLDNPAAITLVPSSMADQIDCLNSSDHALYVGTPRGLLELQDRSQLPTTTSFKDSITAVAAFKGRPLVATRRNGAAQLFVGTADSRPAYDYAVRHLAVHERACFVWNPTTTNFVTRLDQPDDALPFKPSFLQRRGPDGNMQTVWLKDCTLLTASGHYLYYTSQVGTKYKLSEHDLTTNTVRTLSDDCGLVRQIAMHPKSGLWVASSKGLCHVPPSGSFRIPIKVRPINAVAISGDRLYFSSASELRWVDGLEGTTLQPEVRLSLNPWWWPHTSGVRFQVPVTRLDCQGRIYPEYLESLPAVLNSGSPMDSRFSVRRDDHQELSVQADELPFWITELRVKVTDIAGNEGTSEPIIIWGVPEWAKISLVLVPALVALVLGHRRLVSLVGIMDWEVWYMADYQRITSIPSNKGGWQFETQLPTGLMSEPAAPASVTLANAKCRSFRLVLSEPPPSTGPANQAHIGRSVRPMEEHCHQHLPSAETRSASEQPTRNDPLSAQLRVTFDSLVPDYLMLRGRQDRPLGRADFEPVFGAIGLRNQDYLPSPAVPEVGVPDVATSVKGKPAGPLVFWTVNHFNERPEQEVLKRLRWYRWSSWAWHLFGLIKPRYIMDALRDPVRGWNGAKWMGTRGGQEADKNDFLDALLRADVVHVLAHGDSDQLTQVGVTVGVLDEFLCRNEDQLRTRLVVFSSCLVGRELIVPLVRRGVTVIAPRTKLHWDVLISLFTEFYYQLFPGAVTQGITISEAYRQALKRIPTADLVDGFEDELYNMVIYGDPSLCFRCSWKVRDAWRRFAAVVHRALRRIAGGEGHG